ncbi:hypothetical protein ACILE2_11140 [Capnocytophaga canimorsus]|uniref:hypothetical protein n=1 Tax=Capnocytophaga canimorsus TaxID=28188 RepID=UPI0037D5FB86
MGNISDKEKSRIKMVVLTNHGHNNIVWYSPTKQNSKKDEFIITGMMRRFEKRPEITIARCIQFYDTTTNQLIAEYK